MTDEMTEKEILHILRNPHGKSYLQIVNARLGGADLIERYKEAYEVTKDWAEENGVDCKAYNR